MRSCSQGSSWKLRAGQPVLMCGCPCKITPGSVYYVMQTFGGEEATVVNHKATTELLESADFIGINPDGQFESANYAATQYTTSDGAIVFNGQEKKLVTYINEDEVPGVENFIFI